jgi:mRNA interferase RelE/StbE
VRSIVFTPAAARQWVKLGQNVRNRIDARLTALAETGRGDVKRLRGRNASRLRVGDWRVIFFEEENAIVIVAVGHWREIYD